jgi:hypothetical protein
MVKFSVLILVCFSFAIPNEVHFEFSLSISDYSYYSYELDSVISYPDSILYDSNFSIQGIGLILHITAPCGMCCQSGYTYMYAPNDIYQPDSLLMENLSLLKDSTPKSSLVNISTIPNPNSYQTAANSVADIPVLFLTQVVDANWAICQVSNTLTREYPRVCGIWEYIYSYTWECIVQLDGSISFPSFEPIVSEPDPIQSSSHVINNNKPFNNDCRNYYDLQGRRINQTVNFKNEHQVKVLGF